MSSGSSQGESEGSEWQSDCVVFRSIAATSRQRLEKAKDAELHFSELLQVRRADLAACAHSHRVDLENDLDAEEVASEVCEQEYAQWIRAGVGLRSARQEHISSAHSLQVLGGSIERYCANSREYVPVPSVLQ
jgi:hypothetical protein